MIPEEYKKYFWDCDFKTLDWEKHKIYITERILMFGNIDSVRWLQNLLKPAEMLVIVRKSAIIDAKTRNYWEIMLNND